MVAVQSIFDSNKIGIIAFFVNVNENLSQVLTNI